MTSHPPSFREIAERHQLATDLVVESRITCLGSRGSFSCGPARAQQPAQVVAELVPQRRGQYVSLLTADVGCFAWIDIVKE